jgi:hypothetical protein
MGEWEDDVHSSCRHCEILISMIEDLSVSATVLTGPSVRPTKQDCLLPWRREYEELRGL